MNNQSDIFRLFNRLADGADFVRSGIWLTRNPNVMFRRRDVGAYSELIVRLHNTDIATVRIYGTPWRVDSVTLDAGGWFTQTTTRWMGRVLKGILPGCSRISYITRDLPGGLRASAAPFAVHSGVVRSRSSSVGRVVGLADDVLYDRVRLARLYLGGETEVFLMGARDKIRVDCHSRFAYAEQIRADDTPADLYSVIPADSRNNAVRVKAAAYLRSVFGGNLTASVFGEFCRSVRDPEWVHDTFEGRQSLYDGVSSGDIPIERFICACVTVTPSGTLSFVESRTYEKSGVLRNYEDYSKLCAAYAARRS